ncbi:MAG: NAD(P)H-hydrate dehydratase [Limisphaerales bacterium]
MSVPVISVTQMREWEEATWASGQSAEPVMRLAGQAVAEVAMSLTDYGDSIVLLAGKGNNGGDTKYAAEYLTDRQVTLIYAAKPAQALQEFSAGERPKLIVDGLFGIGLNRPLADEWPPLIDAVNDSECIVLAVDAPSGLNCDSGEIMGSAIRAHLTVTFAAPKTGLIKHCAAEHVGKLVVADDIGLIPCPHAGVVHWTLPQDFTDFPTPRPDAGHKGTFGHLVIIAGSQGYHGAAALAARAAHRAMPGLVSLFTTETAYPLVAAQLQQTMVHPVGGDLPEKATAFLIGPGLAGNEASIYQEQCRELWREAKVPVVADASALTWLPSGESAPAPRVITPHPGEAARLLGVSNAEIQGDRVQAATGLREKFGCHVVLKGRQTVVKDLGGIACLNESGNAGLGQGGSGDVLAGYLAGLIAQPILQDDLDRLIRFGVWEHGRVADRLSHGRYAWDLEDLIPLLGNSRLNH